MAAHVPDGHRRHAARRPRGRHTRDVAQVDHWVEPREVDGRRVGEATFELPGDLPLGLAPARRDDLDGRPLDPATTEATLVVTPQRLALPPALAEGRVVGLQTQLYQVRSEESWGIGDLRDLADLATWAAAAHDADFVLINPLHAAEPVVPVEPSPYLPTTRRFVSPLYLRVEDVPEMGRLEHAAHRQVLRLAATARALNGDRPDRPRRRVAAEAGGAARPLRRRPHRPARRPRSRRSATARARG